MLQRFSAGKTHRGSTLKVTESLRKLQRFRNDSFLLLIVSYFGVTGQREIFSERVSFESIIGEDTAKIRVSTEEDSIHIPRFTFVPVNNLAKSATIPQRLTSKKCLPISTSEELYD